MIRALKESQVEESRLHFAAVSMRQKERDQLEIRLEALSLDKVGQDDHAGILRHKVQ